MFPPPVVFLFLFLFFLLFLLMLLLLLLLLLLLFLLLLLLSLLLLLCRCCCYDTAYKCILRVYLYALVFPIVTITTPAVHCIVVSACAFS